MMGEKSGFSDAEKMELADYLAAFEAQEVIIREGGNVVQGLKDELAQERKMRQAFETLYNAGVMGARRGVAESNTMGDLTKALAALREVKYAQATLAPFQKTDAALRQFEAQTGIKL